MLFIDQTEIWVSSGDGGDGVVSFRRARNLPKLGPDGGDGGDGGSVYLCADLGLNTLATLRYRKEYSAEHGGKGSSSGKTGRRGESLRIKVPLGTVALDASTGRQIGEVTDHNTELLVAKGGTFGLGNQGFASATNRAPRQSTPGTKGQHILLRLELKVLADVGLAGMPNAGKSTLLSRLSHAKPKIADYPFTTLHPILGMVEDKISGRSFVVADIPGLIEGASHGKGLGFEFLRHLERTKIIACILDASHTCEELVKNYHGLLTELLTYNSAFNDKKRIVVLNKIDLLNPEELAKRVKAFAEISVTALPISAVTGVGLNSLILNLGNILERLKTENG